MPNMSLGPDDYRFKGNDGRWYRRDDKRFLLFGLVASVAILILIFWVRDELSSGILFGVSALFAACAGIFLGNLLKDVY